MQENKGLDKRQLISFMVMSAIVMAFMLYSQYTAKKNPPKENPAKVEQKSVLPTPAVLPQNVSPASVQNVKLQNDELILEFSPVGAQISKVELPKYKAYDQKTDKADLPLNLFDKNNSAYSFQFKDASGKIIDTRNIVFAPQVAGNTVTFTGKINSATIQFIYQLLPKYTVNFNVKTQGLSQVTRDANAGFVWDFTVKNQEKGRDQELSHTEFSYAFRNYDKYDYDARSEMDEPDEKLNWIGVKQQFFASLIEAENGGFTQSKGNQENIKEGEFLKKFHYTGNVAMNGGEISQNFKWYFLPLDLKFLKSFEGKNFGEILPFGWSFIGGLNRLVFIPLYNALSSTGLAAGWVIFLMTIIVKLVLSPVMFKQHKLSAMMRVIRPEIDEVNAKFKDADPMKKQQATMEVYRKAGVNQMAGCLPALLQVPLFYALFRFFPNMIDLRGKSFWFAKDLTAYDDVIKWATHLPLIGNHLSIFALACTIVILIYTIMTSGQMQAPQQEGMPNMKVMMYIFPITFLFFLNSAASGLSWYYFVSNAINILIILVIKNWILDEKKIHAQIQANKAKEPKAEGKFQKRMREMMEKAQEQQRVQETPNKKKK